MQRTKGGCTRWEQGDGGTGFSSGMSKSWGWKLQHRE